MTLVCSGTHALQLPLDAKEMEIGETIETRKFRRLIRCNRMVANAFYSSFARPSAGQAAATVGSKHAATLAPNSEVLGLHQSIFHASPRSSISILRDKATIKSKWLGAKQG